MKIAKVSAVYNEGRGRKRGVGEGDAAESSRMARRTAKARKNGGYGENEGPLTRNMLRDTLAVKTMLLDKERRNKEKFMAKETEVIVVDMEEVEKETEVVVVDEEEVEKETEVVVVDKGEVEKETEVFVVVDKEEVKQETEGAIGEAEKKVVDGEGGGGVSLENWVIGWDDWGWTWTFEETSKWSEAVSYPYWETIMYMCDDQWLASKPDEDVPDDDIWNLKDTKDVAQP
ncbi:hypothetical protein FCV25MIE_19650 [Fagus crenata]